MSYPVLYTELCCILKIHKFNISNKQCEKSTINYQQNNQESKVIEAKLINELPSTIHRIVLYLKNS